MRKPLLLVLVSMFACSSGQGTSSVESTDAAGAQDRPNDFELPAGEPASEVAATVAPDADALATIRRGAHVVWAMLRPAEPDAETLDGFDARFARSYVLDAEGNVIGEIPFAVVTGGGRYYRWNVEQVTFRRTPCYEEPSRDTKDDTSPEITEWARQAWESEKEDLQHEPTRQVDEASLIDLESGEKHGVGQRDDEGMQDFRYLVHLDRSLAGHAFVREYEWGFSCGAHGNHITNTRVLDLATLESVDLAGELDASALAQADEKAQHAFAGMREWKQLPGDGGETRLVELLPRFGESGALSFDARFLTFAPYAFSTGWAGYQIDTVVGLGSALPKTFAAHAQAPHAVTSFAHAHPELEIGGYF